MILLLPGTIFCSKNYGISQTVKESAFAADSSPRTRAINTPAGCPSTLKHVHSRRFASQFSLSRTTLPRRRLGAPAPWIRDLWGSEFSFPTIYPRHALCAPFPSGLPESKRTLGKFFAFSLSRQVHPLDFGLLAFQQWNGFAVSRRAERLIKDFSRRFSAFVLITGFFFFINRLV